MSINRVGVVDANFREHVRALVPAPRLEDLDAPLIEGFSLTARDAIGLFEAQIESRLCDVIARELKNDGQSFYTIGSAGHEGNAAVAAALRPDDPAFLHYRSGAFFLARCAQRGGPEGAFDVLLGLVASSDEPIAGGRHKVFGSLPLAVPPQTSTIASQLPKALGCAVSIDRRARLRGERDDRVVVCTFGDASVNHATAQTALNAAAHAAHQNVNAPVLFVCEDNGIGISVRTPGGWIASRYRDMHGLRYFHGDGLHLAHAYEAARQAVAYVRRHRRPAFLHLDTVRLLGHAGSDVEQLYRTSDEIEAAEARDPLRTTASLLVEAGALTPEQVLALYDETRERLGALAREATRRPKLETAEAVMAPLFRHDPAEVAAGVRVAPEGARQAHFGELPETSERPRHLAFQLNRALGDVLLAHPEAILFGEDVARKGGVYHVTADLSKKFGVGRVFNTLLDETTILGLAMGAGHAGLLPLPEIQYLAYIHNALDQLRSEACSMAYFSQGAFENPMVVRIAGLAYQKGFGGHFHNDNGIAAVREIPGVLFGCPSRGDDAVRMLRTMVSAASTQGRVCVFLEPIALYMTKDVLDGDGAWLTTYPAPDAHLPVGEVGVYGDDDADLCITSFANGLWMSLRVAHRLRDAGHRVSVIDLRWLAPLPITSLLPHAEAAGRMLVVDECRRSSGIADTVAAEITEGSRGRVRVARVTGQDTYIPLAAAANLVLVSEDDIERAALALLEAE